MNEAQAPPPGPADRLDQLKADLLELALAAAHRAGALLHEGRPDDLGVAATKSSPVDVVTEMDVAADRLITGFLAEHRPDDTFLAEESGLSGATGDGTDPDAAGGSGVRWVIDPLDGTVNYLYGLPSWGVSIAAEYGGETVVGVVEVPSRGETFRAVLGHGAFLNAKPISCRPSPPLDEALVGTGFNYVRSRRTAQAEVARQLVPRLRDIRRSGSAALDLCDVAAGRLDGFYERGLNPWDYAAGELVAREAGALSGGRPGGPPDGDLTVVASPGVFTALQPLLDELGAWHD
ncbi:inositol monophosphatase family protein [Streptomyces sp. Z26]|uniref:inositol monophosphatase family protein n=1 Tax=Streptomyces sp. Z26 TaxID=2500177 RepID=UPI000EF16654|nr:inositol monophosphatase family protein [Streptomyces sp. Z26]RLL69251.1 inositol monophosphatase [Streptomyces sp. Z26]